MSDAKTILITGGSRGIGREVALMAGARGWRVGVNYRADQQMAQQTAADVTAAGGQAITMPGDVRNEDDVTAMFDATEAAFGRIDIVIVNAGVVAPPRCLADMETDRLTKVLGTNVIGSFLTAREAARRLPRPMDEESASIVMVSSAASRIGSPFEYVDYAASKGAMDSLTLGLSKELAEKNVRVNAVRPGFIDTEIHASGGQPDRAERLGKTVPMRRAGTAAEVADAILWLCSPGAAYTTGALLDIAGGR